MNTKEHQKGEMENTQLPHDLADQTKPVDESRRRFNKSGLAISGVILTLASRSVLGDLACKSPSGFLSGNVSVHGAPQLCSGLTPVLWHSQSPELWPSPYTPNTLFKSVFNPNQTYDKTLMLVLADPNQLGAYIVAALLNAQKGLTPVLTVVQVINMFNEWNQNGYFEPTAGVHWYAPDIVAYLQATMS